MFSCTKTRARCLAAACGAAAGAAVFLWLYGAAVLDPGWDAWILNGYDEWDIQQHYAGWLLFRNSHWTFPLGFADTIAAPDGTAISYTDSLPWVSIFFKLLRGMLPATFQWFGLYTLLCFALQGAAGALLCTRGARCGAPLAVGALLSGALFACLPTLWERAFRHVALASQWLFLFALYAFLEQRAALRSGGRAGAWPWWFAVLGFASVGIHPYFLPPVMVCALLAAVERGRVAHAWGRAALDFLAAMAAAVLGGVLCGAIGAGGGLSRGGYGEFSMNANALWNPSSRGDYTWSRLLPVLPQQTSQYDGFNYLGLGVLALLAAALVLAAAACLRRPAAVRGWWGRNWPVAAACAFLTAFALSNRVTWGMRALRCRCPKRCSRSAASSAPAGGCSTWSRPVCLPGRYTPCGPRCSAAPRGCWLACAALAAVLAVQVWDLSAAAAQSARCCSRTCRSTPRPSTTMNLPKSASATPICWLPGRCGRTACTCLRSSQASRGWRPTWISRSPASTPGRRPAAPRRPPCCKAGQYDRTAVYVTTDAGLWESWRQIFAGDDSLGYYVADSCYFMVPLVQ